MITFYTKISIYNKKLFLRLYIQVYTSQLHIYNESKMQIFDFFIPYKKDAQDTYLQTLIEVKEVNGHSTFGKNNKLENESESKTCMVGIKEFIREIILMYTIKKIECLKCFC